MSDGKVVMTFENVRDPQGIKRLVEALKRQQGAAPPWNDRPWLRARMRAR